MKKFEELKHTYVNGNISIFKAEVRKMRKITLLKFIDYLGEDWGHSFTVRKILSLLESK